MVMDDPPGRAWLTWEICRLLSLLIKTNLLAVVAVKRTEETKNTVKVDILGNTFPSSVEGGGLEGWPRKRDTGFLLF